MRTSKTRTSKARTTKTRTGKHGLVKQGLLKHGLVKHGLLKHGLVQPLSQGLSSCRPLERARRDPGWVWSRVSQNLGDDN